MKIWRFCFWYEPILKSRIKTLHVFLLRMLQEAWLIISPKNINHTSGNVCVYKTSQLGIKRNITLRIYFTSSLPCLNWCYWKRRTEILGSHLNVTVYPARERTVYDISEKRLRMRAYQNVFLEFKKIWIYSVKRNACNLRVYKTFRGYTFVEDKTTRMRKSISPGTLFTKSSIFYTQELQQWNREIDGLYQGTGYVLYS
jgi:hypothetical protein